jgi:hypothetical protein
MLNGLIVKIIQSGLLLPQIVGFVLETWIIWILKRREEEVFIV